jgi:hypothetical protein
VISVDQFRYDYLERFAPYFASDGFRRFLDHGANFTHAMYTYFDNLHRTRSRGDWNRTSAGRNRHHRQYRV